MAVPHLLPRAHPEGLRGQRATDPLCGYNCGDSPKPLPFRIRECSSYSDQRRFDFRGRTGRTAGFVTDGESMEHEEDSTEVNRQKE